MHPTSLLVPTVHLSASGPVDPSVAWQRYVDPAAWSTWAPQVREVRINAGRIASGLTGTVQGPAGLAVAFVIDRVDEEARTWSWTVRPLCPPVPFVRLQLDHQVRAEAGGTCTTLDVTGPLLVVLPYLPIARYALSRLVRP